MIYCPLYDVDFKDIKSKKDLNKVGGCTLYVKEGRCKGRKSTGVCVAENREDRSWGK